MQHRQMTARWLHAFALLAMLFGMPLIVGSVAAAGQNDDEAVLRVHQPYYPASLDPQKSAGVDVAAVLSTVYEGLTRLDQDLNVMPAAAESWEVSPDGMIYTFRLREGLTYSDGTPLTAERFADAVRRTCDPNILGDYQHILFDVAGCQEFATLYVSPLDATPATQDVAAFAAARANVAVHAPDERTLEIQLTHPASYFPAIAGMPVFYPAKQELIARGGEDWWHNPALQVGNGPFRVVEMVPEQRVTFAANDRYWGGRPKLDRLEFIYVAASEVALEAYRVGDLDVVNLDEGMVRSIEEDALLSRELVRGPGASTFYLSLNLTKEPFTDKKVREAFAYAFDREVFCEVLRDGACLPALSWIPPDLPGAVATEAYVFDPDRARQALAESSYGGPEQLPEITFDYWVEFPAAVGMTEWIAGQYRDILGVEVTLQPLEGQTLAAAMTEPETYPQMTLTGWVQDYPDPQNWLSVYWTCAASYAQDVGYCNPAFDDLVAQADREPDPAERLALYEAAGQILIEDVPAVFISHGSMLYLVKPEVSGYVPTASDLAWPGQTASPLTVTINR